ncbi:MAG: hypothetical protein D6800_03910, partial [Candidatus Zixiibacteriota bacterium]
YGKVTNEANKKLTDINWREKIILIPLVVFIFWIGIYPKPFFDRIEPAVQDMLVRLSRAGTVQLDENWQLRDVNTAQDKLVFQHQHEEETDE